MLYFKFKYMCMFVYRCVCVCVCACARLPFTQSHKPRQAEIPVHQVGTLEMMHLGMELVPAEGCTASWMMVCHLNMHSMAFASLVIARSPLIQEQCE